jgi:hypothetical protein
MRKRIGLCVYLLLGSSLFAQDQRQHFIFATTELKAPQTGLYSHLSSPTDAGMVTDNGCGIRGFARQTWTEAAQFGRGLERVPRNAVRPSNLKRELPILATTGILIAKVDRRNRLERST